MIILEAPMYCMSSHRRHVKVPPLSQRVARLLMGHSPLGGYWQEGQINMYISAVAIPNRDVPEEVEKDTGILKLICC